MSAQAYRLGVDLGTTYTAAAVAVGGSHRVVRLGRSADDVPSVVLFQPDGTLAIGEEAERLAAGRPSALAREFKRRLGDPIPLIIDGRPFSPQTLMANLLRWTVATVTARLGSQPELITVTCPANWGPYKQELLTQVITLAEVPDTIICTEPEAAAIHYTRANAVSAGSIVAVYDLGGGTFDAAALRATSSGTFALAGRPEGIEQLGGIDFQEALFSFALHAADADRLELSESADPEIDDAVAAIRQRCETAKVELSSHTSTSIVVELPGLRTEVRVTRGEFEEMIRPALTDTVRALHRSLRSGSLSTDDVSAVVLVGGSARIPLVQEMVAQEFDRQVVVMPPDPTHSVALGAAIAAERYRRPPAAVATRQRPAPPPTPRPEVLPSRREASVVARELVRRPPGHRLSVARWLVREGTDVAVGQPILEVLTGASDPWRRIVLGSPYEGRVHRLFLSPGAQVQPEDLLLGYRNVQAYLARPGRRLPGDTGVTVTVPAAAAASARSGRPVVILDRVPRVFWWGGELTVLTAPGRHRVDVAYVRNNQWFGHAGRTVELQAGELRALSYCEPGGGVTAALTDQGRSQAPSGGQAPAGSGTGP